MKELFSRNKKTNKQLAMVILGIQIAQVLGVLKAVGLDLSQFGLGGFTVMVILQTVGLGWIMLGLWKYRIG